MNKDISIFEQIMFDCAMELLYHTERLSDKEIGEKMLKYLTDELEKEE